MYRYILVHAFYACLQLEDGKGNAYLLCTPKAWISLRFYENFKRFLYFQSKQTEDELLAFRQQWQRELESSPNPQVELEPQRAAAPAEPLTDEEKVLFSLCIYTEAKLDW